MAENNKAIKLYTGDVVAATSSKGNQEKWYDAATDCWYKLDRIGFEALAETVTSELLQRYSNIETELGYRIVAYHIDSVEVHRNTRRASVSFNFLREGQSIQTAYHILKRALGSDYQKILAAEKALEISFSKQQERIEYVIRFIDQSCGLNIHAYLSKVLTLDMICLNEDRHLNNIAILEENGKYHYCPLFDNGEGLMLDNVKYPFDVETRGLMKHLRAKPFQCRFGTILSAARDLYGAQLKIVCSAAEVSEIAEKYLDWYQPMFRPFLKERIVDVVLLQMKKYF